ncbi:MAG: MATE family efflux transporter [Mogibacterium diversum]|nr:MATE family efflux transporter [Mogibacterium diversum]
MSAVVKENENKLGTAPIPSLIIRLSVPLMVSMFVLALYNIVDSIFVAQINEDALTATSLCFPIQSMMIAFGVGTAVGMSALISRYLGAKDFDKVNATAQNGIFLSFVTYALFVVIGLFARPFIEMQTSDSEIIEYGVTYLRIVCWLSVMVFLQVTIERLLQSTGKTIYIFICQSIGAIINIIMDPILIFGLFGAPKMGIAGAAIATVFGQTVGALLGLYFNIKKNREIKLTFKGFRPNWNTIKEIYEIGIPSIIMQSVGSFMVFGLNQILVKFITTAVAAFGAYFKLQSFIFMPVFGMNNGIVPIIAYNYGAQNRKRVNEAMRLAAIYGIVLMTFGMIVLWVIPHVLLGFFAASPQLMRIGTVELRVISLVYPLAGYSIMRIGVFQALGKSIYSMYVSIVRQLVVLLPAAYLLSKLGNVDYVWFSFVIAEFFGLAMSIIYTRRIRRDIIDKL